MIACFFFCFSFLFEFFFPSLYLPYLNVVSNMFYNDADEGLMVLQF